jgi:hypothetical protein
MPVSYEIDTIRRIIRTRCTGDVTLPEVIEHFRQLEHDPDCARRLDVLLDLTKMTSVPSRGQLQAVANEIGRVGGRVRFGACAILVASEALSGAATNFEALAGSAFRTTKTFREPDQAKVWLSSQRSMV